ncbi:MAG: elongation factor 1-beta [Candidatus Nezhaarchaeota archaeon]|nr:elongation factor 1-beta [Candidatus Nezhaarchaeota archaeon]
MVSKDHKLVVKLAKVMALLRVLPAEAEVDIEGLRREVERGLPSDVKLQRAYVEEVAFGIKAIKLLVLLPEEEGAMFRLEEAILKVPGVGQVDVEFETRT